MCPSARPSKTEPSLRECGVKTAVSAEEHSECCETETENALTSMMVRSFAPLSRGTRATSRTLWKHQRTLHHDLISGSIAAGWWPAMLLPILSLPIERKTIGVPARLTPTITSADIIAAGPFSVSRIPRADGTRVRSCLARSGLISVIRSLLRPEICGDCRQNTEHA